MPITPLEATGVLEITMNDGYLTHKTNLWVKVAAGADPGDPQTIEAFTGISDDILASALVPKITDVLKPLYDVGSTFINYRVWRFLSGVKTLYEETNISTAGTDSSGAVSYSPANQVTFLFKDDAFKKVKLTFLGTVLFGQTSRYTDISSITLLKNIKDEFLNTGATHVGNFVMGRSGHQLKFFNSVTTQRNNSAERRRLRALRG